MKYYLDLQLRNGLNGEYNALSKARIDISRTLNEIGWKPLTISSNTGAIKSVWTFRFIKLKIFCKLILKLFLRIKPGDHIFIQYPSFNKVDGLMSQVLKIKRCTIEYVIHDLEYLRCHNNHKAKQYEIKTLSHANRVIAHNESMRDELVKAGIAEDKISIIYLFDYYSMANILPYNELINKRDEVAFAGNLNKSGFLYKLRYIPLDIKLNLYGLDDGYWQNSGSSLMQYKGCFKPDDPSILSAGWGLIWDGEEIYTCSGVMGNYLRYNTSHKLSLYLSSGIPVIVWKESAITQFILENNLGIAIDSLEDIPLIINSISKSDYTDMLYRVEEFGKRLRQGAFLKKHLQ